MRKLNIILHETTIINFPFFWKLLNRYKAFSLVVPLVVFSITFFNYKSQNDIYQRNVSFKYNVGDVDSPTSAIATLIGEKTSVMTDAQIIAMTNSIDFQRKFAEKISKRNDLFDLNLSAVNSKKDWDMRSLLASCASDQQCIVERLRGPLFGKVIIIPDPAIENHFILKSTTLNTKTTNVLLQIASELIVETRLESTKKQIKDQLAVSITLQDEKEKELSEENVDYLLERQKSATVELKEVTYKINSIYSEYTRTKHRLEMMKTKFIETKKLTKSSVADQEKRDFEKRTKLERKIKDIQSDIWAVEKATGLATSQDQEIIKQLQKNLNENKRKLAAMGRRGRRSVASTSNYIEKKTDESNYVEFDFNVMKKQYMSMEKDYKLLSEKKEKLTGEIVEIESKLNKLKPTIEYVKLISTKIIQLRLLESTVVSDLVFEEEFGHMRVFKKVTKNKFLIFSFALAFFLVSLSVITRYLFDDRIYDKKELEKSFEDLTIIGNTPDFD